MQRYPCKVHMHFAANTINHSQLMYHSFTSGRRTYHQHIVKNENCRCVLTSPAFLQLHLAKLWTPQKRTMSLWPAQSITSCANWWHGCSAPAGAWAPWEWGSYFANWQIGHLFTLLCSLALPCEHSQASKRKQPLCDTHLTLKSSAASLALSISSMMRAFSSVFFLTWSGDMLKLIQIWHVGLEMTSASLILMYWLIYCKCWHKVIYVLSTKQNTQINLAAGALCSFSHKPQLSTLIT